MRFQSHEQFTRRAFMFSAPLLINKLTGLYSLGLQVYPYTILPACSFYRYVHFTGIPFETRVVGIFAKCYSKQEKHLHFRSIRALSSVSTVFYVSTLQILHH